MPGRSCSRAVRLWLASAPCQQAGAHEDSRAVRSTARNLSPYVCVLGWWSWQWLPRRQSARPHLPLPALYKATQSGRGAGECACASPAQSRHACSTHQHRAGGDLAIAASPCNSTCATGTASAARCEGGPCYEVHGCLIRRRRGRSYSTCGGRSRRPAVSGSLKPGSHNSGAMHLDKTTMPVSCIHMGEPSAVVLGPYRTDPLPF